MRASRAKPTGVACYEVPLPIELSGRASALRRASHQASQAQSDHVLTACSARLTQNAWPTGAQAQSTSIPVVCSLSLRDAQSELEQRFSLLSLADVAGGSPPRAHVVQEPSIIGKLSGVCGKLGSPLWQPRP